jgi:hypothetical protein
MRNNFKFFKGFIGTLNIMDEVTYPTASIYNPNEIRTAVNANPLSNNEMERWMQDYEGRRIETERRLRLSEEFRVEAEQLRLFQATTTVTVNPTPWTKVKIFGTGIKLVLIETWRVEPIGVVFVSALTTIITIIGIAKILSIW